jgi:hypothetical protein
MLRLIAFLFLFSCFTAAQADIGETYDMLNKREQLLKENERLLNGRNIDSLNVTENSRYIENLHIISLIDQDIFKSQKETVDRLSGTSGNQQYVNKSIALFCFLLAVMLALSLYMIYLLNNKLNRLTNEDITFSGRVRELFSVLLVNFQPAQVGKKEVAVNRLIILGMVFMFISFLGYLLKTLGV